MKTKLLLVMLFLFLIIGIGGCEDNEQKPEEKILGKWVIEATGVTEDKMFPYDPYDVNDDHFDFLSDKTVWHYCGTCVGEKYFQAATYKIDSEHFYWYTKDCDDPEAYKTPSWHSCSLPSLCVPENHHLQLLPAHLSPLPSHSCSAKASS